MILLAQLSDLHIREPGRLAYGRLDTAPYLQEAVRTLRRLPQRPDAVVVTGDLTDFGRPEEYAHLARLLEPLSPVYLLGGNHDDPQALRRAFPQHDYLGRAGDVRYSLPLGELQLIAIDTTIPGASHGALNAERLDWLDRALNAVRDQPVVLAMHHPPFETLIGHMDTIGLVDGVEALEALVRAHPNVERIICGHLHRPIAVRFGGSIACTCPAPAHQVVLDLGPKAASQWTLEPGGFKLHAWSGRRLVTHLMPIGRFEGPYPFHDGGRLID